MLMIISVDAKDDDPFVAANNIFDIFEWTLKSLELKPIITQMVYH